MPIKQNFELAPRSVPNKSYEARCKLRPLIEVLRYCNTDCSELIHNCIEYAI